ncbi:MAG TPA: NAD-dependent epimerase/dehydratase family protein, partial [Chthoniobacterales bacterium]|nr:NAD-dependent epimerase/dehydratase family protein [Chthoniobacterales bacterium]
MARILIAGCGYVGEAAADYFHANGWEVEGWTASAGSAAKLAGRPYLVHAVDIIDREAIAEGRASARPGHADFDVAIHCASTHGGDEEQYRRLYLEGATNLRRAFPNATLIFTSSTSVYAQKDGALVEETSAAQPAHRKGKLLRETEALVLASGGMVARLGGIHGPGRSYFLKRILEGGVVGSRGHDRLINHVHRDDIVTALFLLAEKRSQCSGQIYNVVADQPISAGEALQWLATRLKKSLPEASDSPREGTRAETNKHVSNRKLRALGWRPRYPTFDSAM